jgi:hypothetical protein
MVFDSCATFPATVAMVHSPLVLWDLPATPHSLGLPARCSLSAHTHRGFGRALCLPLEEVRASEQRAVGVQVLMDEDDVAGRPVSSTGQVHGNVPSTCREDRSVCVDTVSVPPLLIATSARSLTPGISAASQLDMLHRDMKLAKRAEPTLAERTAVSQQSLASVPGSGVVHGGES